MKRGLALSLIVALVLMVCDIPALSELVSEDPYHIYSEYKDSLCTLQQDIAQIHLELRQGKNPPAVYEHMLQTVELTATLIGKAELASHNIHDGLQSSLQSHLELLLTQGLSEEQKTDLINLGYTEEDINNLLNSLLHYNDYYHHVITGFSAEEVEWFYSLGLTDEHIAELQDDIYHHYTQVHRFQQVVKHHQEELMYIQVVLSVAALQTLLELDHQEQSKIKSDELQNAEEKLLEAILNVSEDQKSLEHVKAFSKQMYKAAERRIRKGEEQYFLDFFVGLQVHCGALIALYGDPEFGLTKIRLYEGVVSECVASPERSELPSAQNSEQPSFQGDTVPMTRLMEQTEEFEGQIKESDETNNMGWITLLLKTSDCTMWQFVRIVLENYLLPESLRRILVYILVKIGVEEGVSAFIGHIGGAIFAIIITAPQVGEGWIDHIEHDPSGTFDEIIIDEKTVADIEMFAWSIGEPCVVNGYQAVVKNWWRIAATVRQATNLYKNPWGFYYYYTEFLNGEKWVVMVEDRGYGLGRVMYAYKVLCEPYGCGTHYETITEQWELCENFTKLWSR